MIKSILLYCFDPKKMAVETHRFILETYSYLLHH